MSVSARVHYAAQALVELAIRRDDPSPVSLGEITDRHGVPGPFLTQIMRTLRTRGLVTSIRGAQGGYRLNVDPASITLWDVNELVSGCEATGDCTGESSHSGRRLREVWREAASASEAVMRATTLQDIAEAVRDGDSAMYYI